MSALTIRSGNVGIGTTNPGSRLTVAIANAKPTTNYWHMNIQDETSMAQGVGGGLLFTGYKTGTSAGGLFAGIAGYKANATAGNESGELRLYYSNAGTLTTGMVLDSAGNVGIGTTNPVALLTLKKNSGANTVIELLRLDPGQENQYEGAGSKIVFRDIDVYSDGATIEEQRIGATSGSTLNFRLRNAVTPQMTILSSGNVGGNVGIGTTSPGAKLDVNGNAFITGGGSGSIKLYSSYSGSPSNPGMVITNYNGDITFAHNSNGGGTYISGNVGIGTTVPGAKLEVYTTTNSGGITLNGTSNFKFSMQQSGTEKAFIGVPANASQFITGDASGDLDFVSQQKNIIFSTDQGSTAQMYLKYGGNVGIGTASPGAKLDVAGTQWLTGTTSTNYIDFKPSGTQKAIIGMAG
ncbi:MAG: hypothetical protein NTY33_04930, partial [Candidatus Moranbacteria bacterium]|nr:hypothetical protein [Candidatus Moranbacteria bacterium]